MLSPGDPIALHAIPHRISAHPNSRAAGATLPAEGPAGPWPAVVENARHQAIAGAGLALQQHGGNIGATYSIEAGEVTDLHAQGDDGRRGHVQAISRMHSSG